MPQRRMNGSSTVTLRSGLRRPAAFLIVVGIAACTGETLGEKGAGDDTYLQFGDIAIDERTETSFVLVNEADGGTGVTAEVVSVLSGGTTATQVEDLSGRTNLRMLFPSTGVLVMSQDDVHDRLDLFDQNSLAPLLSKVEPGLYNGTRMSSTRDWVAVADNSQSQAQHPPINLLDMHTLSATVVPNGGGWLEAMWLHNTDELFVITFYDDYTTTAHARILSWRMEQLTDGGFSPGTSGFWPDPRLDIDVPGASPDFFFSFTWIGISPDDSTAVFPVLTPNSAPDAGTPDAGTTDPWTHTLLVVDVASGALRTVADVAGPVGFTPDSKTIVSYAGDSLELVNATTLAVTPETVPIQGGLSYFTSHEGNQIIVGSTSGQQRLILFDLDNGTSTQMAAPGVALDEFVERTGHDELWIVDHSGLYRLDLQAQSFTVAPTSFSPVNINYQPNADKLVMDGEPANDLFFYDPGSMQTTATVPLPGATY